VIEQFDLDTAIKLSQAVSREIVREKVIDALMRTAVEHTGAQRGLLVLTQGVDQRIEAEASTGNETTTVRLRQGSVTAADLPESLFHHVVRTQERVILGDASTENPFSSDDYIRQNHARSVLCLPLVKQAVLIGVLYLENNLTPHVFTAARVGVLKLLASQAAIALENANLYSDLQRREAGLRASEKSLRLIIDTIPGFVCTLSPAGEVELLNRQVLDYFGKTPEDLKNWSTSDAVHPDDLPRVIDGWRRSVETGQPHDLELRQRRADGVYRWFHSRALPARDPEGRITGWYMLLTDIDDRKKAEEELRRSRAYLTEAQRLSRTGSFGCKFSSGEMFWSEETFGIFGYHRATKPAMEAILERVHPEDKARVQEHMHRAASEGKGCDLEYRLLMPDDSVKHVHVMAHASKDEPGRFEFVGAVMDVTAAKEAEERIRQDERELRIIVETIPAIVSSALPDGSIEFISQKWLDYVGRSKEEIVGGAWRSTIHPEDLESVLNNWQAALATGEPFEMETRYQRADGKYRWFLVRAVPLRDDKGIIVKWYATVFDIEDRKRAEQKLQRSEAYLAEAQRLTHTGSWAMNVATGEPTHSSEEHSRMFGFDPEKKDVPSRAELLRRIHPEDRDSIVETLERAIAERTDFEVDFRVILPDGTMKYIHSVSHPVFNAAGDLVEYFGTVMDVTEQHEARSALENAFAEIKKSEAQLRAIIDAIPTQVWCALPDGSTEFQNRRWLDYAGLSVEEARGWGWRDAIHPEDAESYMNKWLEIKASEASGEAEARFRRFDGEYRRFLMRVDPVRDERGNIVKWYGTNTDIEDRKQAEEALRRSEAYLAEAQRLTHTGSWVQNVATGVRTHSSEEFYRLYGFDPETEVPSDSEFRQRIHREDLDRVVETYKRAVGERTDFEIDYRIVLPDGTIKYLHSIGHPVFNAAGDLVEYIGSQLDVTERKRAEEAVLKAQAELAHVTRVATLGEMTASISHEINQPLGAMVNNANACLRWLTASKLEEARQSAMLIAADGYRAGEIIARIRALAQKAPPRKDWLDINKTIQEVITLTRSEVQGNRVSLKTRLGRSVPPILGDRIQLQQVLLNLTMNAIEAMRGIDESVPRELWVDSEKVESSILVSVRDSGPGLDAESLDHLFETFYTTKPEGLGMGLAISRSIIEGHGGRLWATANAPHGGAVFQFTLPIGSERAS